MAVLPLPVFGPDGPFAPPADPRFSVTDLRDTPPKRAPRPRAARRTPRPTRKQRQNLWIYREEMKRRRRRKLIKKLSDFTKWALERADRRNAKAIRKRRERFDWVRGRRLESGDAS